MLHSFLYVIIFHFMDIPHLLIHSSIDGHLGCFHFLAPINNVVCVCVCVCVYLWTYICVDIHFYLLGYIVGWLGHMVTIFHYVRNCQDVFQGGCTLL